MALPTSIPARGCRNDVQSGPTAISPQFHEGLCTGLVGGNDGTDHGQTAPQDARVVTGDLGWWKGGLLVLQEVLLAVLSEISYSPGTNPSQT